MSLERSSEILHSQQVGERQARAEKRPVLSIIIVYYKTLELTLRCIESIYEYAPKFRYEIVLVDNGSEDEIEERLAERFPQVRFIEAGRNLGFPGGNNMGIYNSHGDHILLLNSDTKLIELTLDAMVHYLSSHPEVGVLGPRQVDGQNRFQLSFGHFPTLISEIVRKIIHSQLSISDNSVIRDYLDTKYSDSSVVDWVSGSCLMIRRETLQKIGLLDENIFMYFEDIDLCTRARRAGWQVHYYPYSSLIHYGGRSAQINLLNALISYRKSQLYFSKKYYGFFGSLLIRFLLLVKYGLHSLKWSPIHLYRWFFGGDLRESYTMLLLSKKVMLIIFGQTPSLSPEALLNTPSRL